MAGVLADACALIVFYAGASDGTRPMSPSARDLMASGEVQVAPITVFEITQKVASGKLPRLPTGSLTLNLWLQQEGFAIAPFSWREAEEANNLPAHHKDPMDRMLIATALIHDLPVITMDASFALYGVRTMW